MFLHIGWPTKSSPSQISDAPRAGPKFLLNLNSGFSDTTQDQWQLGGLGKPCLPPPHLFWVAKRKQRKKVKKRKNFNAKTIKRLSPRSKWNITASAILERLEFKNFSYLPIMVADNTFQRSMDLPIWNPFRRTCYTMVPQFLIHRNRHYNRYYSIMIVNH